MWWRASVAQILGVSEERKILLAPSTDALASQWAPGPRRGPVSKKIENNIERHPTAASGLYMTVHIHTNTDYMDTKKERQK